MRIIGGVKGGIRLQVPKNLPVRPTTDLAKEALFNILQYEINLDGVENCLDLFAGTGGISYELASRGAKNIFAVDQHFGCVKFISQSSKSLGFPQITVKSANVFTFLKQNKLSFDFIFADPPFDLDRLKTLPKEIMHSDILKPNGLFVMEFPSSLVLPSIPEASSIRKYGHSSFAFYRHPNNSDINQ